MGLWDGCRRAPRGEQFEGVVRRRLWLGRVGEDPLAAAGGQLQCFVGEGEVADDGMMELLDPGSMELLAAGGQFADEI